MLSLPANSSRRPRFTSGRSSRSMEQRTCRYHLAITTAFSTSILTRWMVVSKSSFPLGKNGGGSDDPPPFFIPRTLLMSPLSCRRVWFSRPKTGTRGHSLLDTLGPCGVRGTHIYNCRSVLYGSAVQILPIPTRKPPHAQHHLVNGFTRTAARMYSSL